MLVCYQWVCWSFHQVAATRYGDPTPWLGGGFGMFSTILIIYCAVTYAIATVDSFAWLLIAMGTAQMGVHRRRTAAAYVAVFMLVLLYRELA